MSKLLKISNTDLTIETSSIMVVQIGNYYFEIDERFSWIEVYLNGKEHKKFVAEIDEDDMPLADPDEFKMYCLKWFFNNVEIVKEGTEC